MSRRHLTPGRSLHVPRAAWYHWDMNKLLEKAMAEVATLPEEEQEALAARILDEVERRALRRGKWARVADRLAEIDVLKGRSGEFERHVRRFRDGFGLRGLPEA